MTDKQSMGSDHHQRAASRCGAVAPTFVLTAGVHHQVDQCLASMVQRNAIGAVWGPLYNQLRWIKWR